MSYRRKEYPEIDARHIGNARLFANRNHMLSSVEITPGGSVVEIGVAQGDFSQCIIDALRPSRFVAIDLFDMHKYPLHWGIPQAELFRGKTHYDFYRDRFASLGKSMSMMKGLSHECLCSLPNHSFDLIYVDAGHDYDNAKRDGELSRDKIASHGIVIFNDYVLYDPFSATEYGVVPAVNELVQEGGWEVVGFALQRHMFCDIVLRRL